MASLLKNYFPTIREKEELLKEIQENIVLRDMYEQLEPELKEEFLNFCTGMKGLKILRDSFFKEVINPEYDPERLEIQKIGYKFPGARSACYTSDMLLRQYRRVRARQGKDFAYSQIKNVYLVVIYEKSPKEFKEFPIHIIIMPDRYLTVD